MAQRVKLTTLVDVDLKSGKVDPKQLNQELPKLLEQAMANLPGAKGVISPDIKVNPKLNIDNIQKELSSLLNDKKFENSLGTAGFKDLEQSVLKYGKALEQVGNLQDKTKVTPTLKKNLALLEKGKDFSSFTPNMQNKIKEFQNYLQGLSKVFAQVQTGLTKVSDQVKDPTIQKDLNNAKRRLITANKQLAKAKAAEQEALDTGVSLGKDRGRGRGSIADQVTKAENKTAKEKATVSELKSYLADSSRHVGGVIDPGVQKLFESVNNLNKTISNQIKESKKKEKVQEKSKKTTAQRQAVSKDFGKKKVEEQTHQELKDFTTALKAQKSNLIGNANKKGELFKDLPEFKAINAKINANEAEVKRRADALNAERKAVREREAEERRLKRKAEAQTERERNKQKEATKTAELAKRFHNTPIENQSKLELTDFKRILSGQKTDLINAAKNSGKAVQDLPEYGKINDKIQKINDELRFRVKELAKSNVALTDQEKQELQLAKRKVKNKKNQIERDRKAVLLSKGRQVDRATPNVDRTKPRDVDARAAFTQTQREFSKRKATRVAQEYGVNSVEFGKASKRVDKLSESLFRLGHAGKFTHPIVKQLGRLLIQFARFGIGYAALYKVTTAIRALSSAVVSLEDDLKGIQAITGSTDTAMLSMAATIKKTANTTSFGLDDIAAAVKTVAQAGVALKDIPNTVQAVANLATATGSSLQTAADVITTAQNIWDSLDPVTISDRVTQAANVSKLAVEDLKTVFNLGGTFFKEGNLSLDQSLGAIATLRNQGIKPSTIGTGTRQLLLELGAPDKKFKNFLVNQYKSVGEKVTGNEAARKFEGFKLTDSPLVSALNELKRIGADSVSALSSLQRSIDRRAFNVLSPLLKNADQLQSQTASFSFAPTARDAAVVAMDSLKKATENLGDATETLASTLSKDALPALADLVRSVTEGVHTIDSLVSEVQKRGGLNLGFSGAGFIAGGVAGAKRGIGLGKIGTAAVGAVLGGTGATAVDVGSKTAFGDSKVSDAVFNTAIAGGIAKAAVDIYKKIFSPKTIIKDLSKGANGLKGAIAKKVTGLIPLLFTPVAGEIVAIIAGIATAGYGALQLYHATIGKDAAKKVQNSLSPSLKALSQTQAEQTANAASAKQDYLPFLPPESGKPLDKGTQSGAYAINQRDLNNLRLRVGEAIGTVLTKDMNNKVLDLVQQINVNGTKKGEGRDKLVSQLSKELGGTTKISEEALQPLLILSGKVSSSFKAQMNLMADTYAKLLSHTPSKGSFQEDQLAALNTLRDSSDAFKNMLLQRNATEETISKGMRKYLEEIQKAKNFSQTDLKLSLKQLAEWVDRAIKVDPLNTADADTISLTISQKLREGVKRFGIEFLKSADQVIQGAVKDSGNFKTEKQVSKNKDGSTKIKLVRVPDKTVAVKAEKIRQNSTLLDISRAQQNGDKQSSGNIKQLTDVVDKIGLFNKLTAKDSKTNLDPNREALKGRVSDALPAVSKVLLEANNLGSKLKSKDAKDNLPALLAEQEKVAKDLSKLINSGVLTRDSKNKLQLGPKIDSLVSVVADEERKAAKKRVVQDFVGSNQYVANTREVRKQENIAAELKRSNPAKLLEKGNPLAIIRDRKIANLQEEIKHIQSQPYNEDKNRKSRLIQDKQDQKNQVRADYTKQIEKISFKVSARAAKVTLKHIEQELKLAVNNRDKLSSVGKDKEVSKLNEKIKNLLGEQADAEGKILEFTKDGADQREGLNNIIAKRKKQEEELLGLNAKIKGFNSKIKFIQGLPSNYSGSPSKDAYSEGLSGGKKSVVGESNKLASEILATRAAINSLENSKKNISDRLANPKAGDNLDSLSAQLVTADKALQGFYGGLGKAERKLADFAPSLLQQINKISLKNIGYQIQDLPQSLKNFGNNTEKRVVGAVDSFASAVADSSLSFVKSLLGMKKATDATTQALSGVLDAQGNLALVKQNRVNIASQINSIKSNELDPARQEILIKQALDAQTRSENIAQIKVDQAKKTLTNKQKEQQGNGFFGQVSNIGSGLIKGVATDYIKGSVLDGFSNLFGNGKRGDSTSKPVYVSVVKDDSITGIVNKATGGGGSGIVAKAVGGVKSLAGDVGNFFSGSSKDKKKAGTGDIKDLTKGVTTALEKPWYSGLTDGLSKEFGSLVDGLGGEFSSFTSAMGVLFGISAAKQSINTQKQADAAFTNAAFSLVGSVASLAGGFFKSSPTAATEGTGSYSPTGKYSPTYDSGSYGGTGGSIFNTYLKKRAKGGFISGPGTTTSDSIPTLLSNEEYVLNAKATKLIGKDVLDSWNFDLKAPIKRAAGGLVEPLANATRNVAKANDNKSEIVQTNTTPQSVRVVLVDDQRRVADYLTSAAGEKTLVDFVRKNSTSVKQLIGK